MEVRHLPHDARSTAQLILADAQPPCSPGPIARRVVQGGAEMSETNGFNCGTPTVPLPDAQGWRRAPGQGRAERPGEPRAALRQPDHGERGQARHGLQPEPPREDPRSRRHRSPALQAMTDAGELRDARVALHDAHVPARGRRVRARRGQLACGTPTARSTSTSSRACRSTTRVTATRGSSPRSPSRRGASTAPRTSSSPSPPCASRSGSRRPRSAARSS